MIFIATAILDEIGTIHNAPVAMQKLLGRFRAFFFYTLVLPCSMIVVTMFWTLWHIDRELIFPRVIDMFLPTWVNHSLHTFIVLPVVVELLQPKTYRFVEFSKAVKILVFYLFVYQTL